MGKEVIKAPGKHLAWLLWAETNWRLSSIATVKLCGSGSTSRIEPTTSTLACLPAALTTSAQVTLADATQTVIGIAGKSVWRLVSSSVAIRKAGARASLEGVSRQHRVHSRKAALMVPRTSVCLLIWPLLHSQWGVHICQKEGKIPTLGKDDPRDTSVNSGLRQPYKCQGQLRQG